LLFRQHLLQSANLTLCGKFLIPLSPLFGISMIPDKGNFAANQSCEKTVIPNISGFGIQLLSNEPDFNTTGGFYMTEQEQKLLQAQHRLEEAQARNRVKERKARTRMLIQKGAILEKAMPETSEMSMEDLENYLYALSLLQG
jgi:hypothetical protein